MAWWEYMLVFIGYVVTWATSAISTDESTMDLSARLIHLERMDEANKLIEEAVAVGHDDVHYRGGCLYVESNNRSWRLNEFRVQLTEWRAEFLERKLAECCAKGKKK